MRWWKAAFATCLSVGLTFTVLAQQIPPSQQEAIDKAHVDILKTETDKAAEAGRLTDALSDVLPRAVPGPVVRKNYIDEHIFGRMERDRIPHTGLASDEEFLRRVYLDATGLLPEPQTVREFLASKDPNKRDRLIDSLIGTDEFGEQWAWLWADLLQTHNAGFSYWFKRGLMLDRPYNEMAKEILSAGVMKASGSNPVWAVTSEPLHVSARALVATDPENYFVLNRLDFMDAMAIGFGRTFLGINMDCISCHDGARHLEPLNLYLTGKKRSEFHQQAAFWARLNMAPLNMTTGNAVLNDANPGYVTNADAPYHTAAESRFPRDGKTYEPAFILTGEKPRPGLDPRKELARLMTSHIQFSRATVNIVWGRLMTVGFVEPYDGFDLARLDPDKPPPQGWALQPTNPWLLEAMAKDFQAHNYSLHHLIKSIMKSSAYQLSAQFPGEWKDAYAPYYARRFARVISGPEVADNLAHVTGVPYDFNWAGKGTKRVKQLSSPIDVNPPQRVGGVNDLGGEGTIEGNSIRALMQSFFQSTRETPALLTNRPSAVQAMLMMTAPTVIDRIATKPDSRLQRLLASSKTDPELVEELFLSTLSRRPNPQEIEVATKILQEGDRRQRAEDLQWALVNTVEFLLNH
ncbi:MAG TPA: DUF1549 domain-containing protein [Vicinamibacterales bacterium]